MTRLLTTATAMLAALLVAAPAQSHGSVPTLVIRHQLRGCHAWSFEHGPYKASLTVTLKKGTSIVVVDNDVMPHKLVQLTGPKAPIEKLASPMTGMHSSLTGPHVMDHMGASLSVAFPRAGTYTFKTRAGEDYMSGMQTIGEDNVLRLKVVVR